jgi:hypothetical protein
MSLKTQFKYALRYGAMPRYIIFGVVFLINLVFGTLAYFDLLPFAAAVTAVSLSGTGLGAVVIANIIISAANLKNVLADGYIYALAPVKSSKILFTRITAIAVQDIAMLTVNIFGVVWLSLYLSGLSFIMAEYSVAAETLNAVFFGLLGLFYYAYIFMLITFCVIVKNSILFSNKAKVLLAILCGFAANWLLSLLDFALFPFADVYNWGLFFNLTIYAPTGTVMHAAVMLVKLIILFIASSKLMERINYQ